MIARIEGYYPEKSGSLNQEVARVLWEKCAKGHVNRRTRLSRSTSRIRLRRDDGYCRVVLA